jgi:uncharacterized membrane protein YgdD (TMEM256/DUF423 family)
MTLCLELVDVHIFLVVGAVLGFLEVAAGSFGTHGLEGILSPEMLDTFEIGVRYQMSHALALLAAGWLADRSPFLTRTGPAGSSLTAPLFSPERSIS